MIQPRTKEELRKLLDDTISEQGLNCDLNFIDTSLIVDMSWIFSNNKQFNGDISKWDLSNVKFMTGMFSACSFNKNISKWNPKNLVIMERMFYNSTFNFDISKWDVSKVRLTSDCFTECSISPNFKPNFNI